MQAFLFPRANVGELERVEARRERTLSFFSTAKQCPCCSDPVRIRIDWNCIYSKSRLARKEHGSWADRCQRAAEQAGCDCVPGCEKKARDLTLVDKRYSTAGCSRCVGWTGLPSGLTTYTLVRWSTLLWAPLGRAGSQVRFVHQRWRPKERGSPGQVAPDFQPLASRAVTLQRGEGGWSFGDRYLAADSCAQTWILRDPGFFIFCTSRLGVAAPKQKTVKDITSRLPFSQSPSSWSYSSHKAKAGSSALVSIVLIPLPEPGNQWSSARQTRRRYGSSASLASLTLALARLGSAVGAQTGAWRAFSVSQLEHPHHQSHHGTSPRQGDILSTKTISLCRYTRLTSRANHDDNDGDQFPPRLEPRRPHPTSLGSNKTTKSQPTALAPSLHLEPTTHLPDPSPPPSPPGGNDIRDTTTSLQTTFLLLNTHPPRRRQLPPHPNGHRIPRASGSSACTGAAGDCNTTTTTAAGPPPERLDNHPDSESL